MIRSSLSRTSRSVMTTRSTDEDVDLVKVPSPSTRPAVQAKAEADISRTGGCGPPFAQVRQRADVFHICPPHSGQAAYPHTRALHGQHIHRDQLVVKSEPQLRQVLVSAVGRRALMLHRYRQLPTVSVQSQIMAE